MNPCATPASDPLSPQGTRQLKVAIVSPGIGRVRRGYERASEDLFRLLRGDVDLWLFKGAGENRDRELTPSSIGRESWLLLKLKLHRLIGRTPYHMECLTYAMSAARRLGSGSFDVVLTYDPPMLKLLWWIRRITRADFRIVFAHGGAFPFEYWPHADVVLHCSPLAYQEDLRNGVDPSKLELLPLGMWPERFTVKESKAELRERHGISESTLLVLSVAALDRKQKRIHHLIEEVAKLEGDVMLWIDGSSSFASDPTLKDLARERLGDRCRMTHGTSEGVAELLAMADVMVLASLLEGFGLVIVEALCMGTPTLTHRSPHFEWVVGRPELLVDMAEEGALADRLQELVADHDALRDHVDREGYLAKYSWPALKEPYLKFLARVAGRGVQSATDQP